ncbi:MAG: hypothetical protein HY677_04910 [Chloroflexi bacterium]|nr:hypothetical protein [Chloroflexota bacterium]
MHPRVAGAIEEIRSDRTHGASFLARRAINTIALAAALSDTKRVSGVMAEARVAAQALLAARPTMVAIGNSVVRYLYELQQEAAGASSPSELASLAQAKAAEMVEASARAVESIAGHAKALIGPGDIVITCSYSSTVCDVLAACKPVRVVAVESRSGDVAYGEIMAERLRAGGLAVEVVPDADLAKAARGATKAVLGADSILADGSVVNGAPSLELAQAAKAADLPLHVVSETNKFSMGGHGELEPGFQRLPAAFVTRIVTEEGPLDPSEVRRIAARLEEYYRAFDLG